MATELLDLRSAIKDEFVRIDALSDARPKLEAIDDAYAFCINDIRIAIHAERYLSEMFQIYSILKRLKGRTIKSVTLKNESTECDPSGHLVRIVVESDEIESR